MLFMLFNDIISEPADWLAEIMSFSVLAQEKGMISMSKCQRPRQLCCRGKSALRADWLAEIMSFSVLAQEKRMIFMSKC
jgi:hypothetical protein